MIIGVIITLKSEQSVIELILTIYGKARKVRIDMQDINTLLKRIDEIKRLIDQRRPLAPEEVKSLNEYFKIDLTYSSNALEGNTLTRSETKVVIEDGLTVSGKSIKEIDEATGHADAYDLMVDVARSDNFEITEDIICKLHHLFYQKIDPKQAGVYRDHQVFISGTEYIPPAPEDVPDLMILFINELHAQKTSMHPVLLAAYAHRKLVDIHPFVDGNGRTARLLMNLILLNKGYPIATISPALRVDYINDLRIAQREKNPSDKEFNSLIAECVLESERDYARMLKINLSRNDKDRNLLI